MLRKTTTTKNPTLYLGSLITTRKTNWQPVRFLVTVPRLEFKRSNVHLGGGFIHLGGSFLTIPGNGLSWTNPSEMYTQHQKISTMSSFYTITIIIIDIITRYSEIPLLRSPKMKASYLLKTIIAKFKLFFSSFSTLSVPLIRDHLWDCPKVVFKTTFGQPQRWS